MTDFLSYWGLFLAAFIAATLLPAQSELVLSGLLLAGKQPAWALIAVASVGNILGSVVNWLMGRYVHLFSDRHWFPVKRENLAKAERWYHKYGRWSLLLSWAPFIGDPLTLVGGLLREPLWSFVLLVALAKTVRYLAVAGVVFAW
jgi:membrane protein YqaA with SNARE-associated domain